MSPHHVTFSQDEEEAGMAYMEESSTEGNPAPPSEGLANCKVERWAYCGCHYTAGNRSDELLVG